MSYYINNEPQSLIVRPQAIRPSNVRKCPTFNARIVPPNNPAEGDASQGQGYLPNSFKPPKSSRPPSVAGFLNSKKTTLERLANINEDIDEDAELKRMAEAEREFQVLHPQTQSKVFAFLLPSKETERTSGSEQVIQQPYKPRPLKKSNLCPFRPPSRPNNPMAMDCLFIKQLTVEEEISFNAIDFDKLSMISEQTRVSTASNTTASTDNSECQFVQCCSLLEEDLSKDLDE